MHLISSIFILQVLNHHIQRVNEAEQERVAAEEVHRSISERMAQLSKEIAHMLEGNARSIRKSRHYFGQRIEFTKILEHQKSLILKLESEVITVLLCFLSKSPSVRKFYEEKF